MIHSCTIIPNSKEDKLQELYELLLSAVKCLIQYKYDDYIEGQMAYDRMDELCLTIKTKINWNREDEDHDMVDYLNGKISTAFHTAVWYYKNLNSNPSIQVEVLKIIKQQLKFFPVYVPSNWSLCKFLNKDSRLELLNDLPQFD